MRLEVRKDEHTSNRPGEPEGLCDENHQLRQSSGWSVAGRKEGVDGGLRPQAQPHHQLR